MTNRSVQCRGIGEAVTGGNAEARSESIRNARKSARGMPVAPGGEEGRDKLRKAAVRGKYPQSAADVRMGKPGRGDPITVAYATGRTQGTETSQYL